MEKGFILFLHFLMVFCGNSLSLHAQNSQLEIPFKSDVTSTLKLANGMAETIMKETPEPWNRSFGDRKYWSYTDGLVLLSLKKLYDKSENKIYYDFVKRYIDADKMIDSVHTYSYEEYNIDMVNASRILFDYYKDTKDEFYLNHIKKTKKQLENHPRTSTGGFWHKEIYPNQMWLDGLYMGQPFYTKYLVQFEEGENLEDVVLQFDLVHKKTKDMKTGLLYHAWDESKKMDWANKENGQSPNFWSRSMGWYVMALVDVLDDFPKNNSGREVLINNLNDISEALIKFQDEKSGMWYQVTNMPDEKGNYLETSGTLMFAYAFAKGVENGYLPQKFLISAHKAFDGVVENVLKVDENGNLQLHNICRSAGLGGNPYRDGSFDYYISEKQVVNDPHGVGPFILAATVLNK